LATVGAEELMLLSLFVKNTCEDKMSGKIIGILSIVCVILVFVLSYTLKKINTLESQKNDLKIEVEKKNEFIKEMEKINEANKQAEKEVQEFREELIIDTTDNLDVVPADYILKRLRAD